MSSSRIASLLFASSLCFAAVACGGATGSSEPGGPTPASSTPSSPSSPDEPSDGTPEEPGTGAAPRAPTKVGELDTPESGALPFHILASNQSFDIDPVDIDLYVDQKHVVTGDFVVEGQHTWVNFDFSIAPGEHTLRAVSKKGAADKTVTFEVDASERWAVVDFWYYATAQGGAEPTPRHFSIDVYDEQPMFD